MSKITKDQEEVLSSMYISGKSISQISQDLGIAEVDISSKVSELKLRVRLNKDQLEVESNIAKSIRSYWMSKNHDVNVYQNEYGEVRSDLVNCMPKNIITSKGLN